MGPAGAPQRSPPSGVSGHGGFFLHGAHQRLHWLGDPRTVLGSPNGVIGLRSGREMLQAIFARQHADHVGVVAAC